MVVLLTSAAPASAASIWTRVTTPPGCQSTITDIEYRSASQAWFATANGEVCRKIGTSWQNELSAGAAAFFTDIEFNAAGTLGLVAGQDGVLYRTTDGGDSWSPLSLPVAASRYSCGATAAVEDISHVRFASDTVVFLFAGPRQILMSSDGGATWANWNRYDPLATGPNSDDQCRYDGKAEDAFFVPGSSVSGFFTGSAGTRRLRDLANATATGSGLESMRPVTACDDAYACTLVGDTTSAASQVARDGTSIRGTDDAWQSSYTPAIPNRGSAAVPEWLDVDAAGGTTVVVGRGGAIGTSTDHGRRIYLAPAPAGLAVGDLGAVSVADATNAAVGGANGALFVTDQANFVPDLVKPLIGPVAGGLTATAGQPVTLSVSPTDEGEGFDASAVRWSSSAFAPVNGTTLTFTPREAGSYPVRVDLTDRAGNAADPVTVTVAVRPFTPPSARGFFFSGGTKPPVAKASGRRVTLTVKGRLAVPGSLNRAKACAAAITLRITGRRATNGRVGQLARSKVRPSSVTCAYSRKLASTRSKLRGKRFTLSLSYPRNSVVAATTFRRSLTLR